MKNMIEDIIRQKPHLADPLRFYQKTLKFRESVKGLPLFNPEFPTAYPPESMSRIFDLFSSVLALPEGTLAPLQHAMELREIDFTRLPLGEIPAFSLPYAEDDLAMLLSLLSKPFFLALRDTHPRENLSWEQGRCPVCHAQPAVSWISEDGKRLVSCSFCSTTGHVNRTGCPLCLTIDVKKQSILVTEQEGGVSINTCDLCRSYIKTVDSAVVAQFTSEGADLVSLPLDILVQEKGYARRSPNPIGLRKLTSQG